MATTSLVATGPSDVYLTGDPEITFWTGVYRKHTLFSMESIMQTMNGTATGGSRVSATISRNGDLVKDVVLQFTVPATATNIPDNLGNLFIEEVDLEIGGQRIDRQYGEFMEIWNELTLPAGKLAAYRQMVGSNSTPEAGQTIYVPLTFFFNRHAGSALPLISLQYHELKINIKFRTGVPAANVELYADYAFLDTEERRRYAQVPREMLIEQVQHTGAETLAAGIESENRIRMNFNHPVKELIWVLRGSTGPFDFGSSNADQFVDAHIKFNGHDRFHTRPASYFRLVQPFQHHSNCTDKFTVYCYSFALNPEDYQPSGTTNFSRIDNATLHMKGADGKDLLLYAVNYNVLIIKGGMAGLAYAN